MRILSKATKQKIEEGNRSLGSKGRIFVFTVKRIDEDIESYAHKTFDVFQLGKKGVLILVVENYHGRHKAAIVVGDELKEVLTDNEIDFILKRTMKPFISYMPAGKVIVPVNKVDKRISDGFSRVFRIIEREGKESFLISPFTLILFLNFIFVACTVLLYVLEGKKEDRT